MAARGEERTSASERPPSRVVDIFFLLFSLFKTRHKTLRIRVPITIFPRLADLLLYFSLHLWFCSLDNVTRG